MANKIIICSYVHMQFKSFSILKGNQKEFNFKSSGSYSQANLQEIKGIICECCGVHWLNTLL